MITTSPLIFNYDKNRVLYLCGTHGNECAPCDAFSRDNGESHIIVNPSACKINRRSYFFQKDINRSYDDNNILIPYIKNNKLIVDFHEAWGFKPPSLGKTIFVNKSAVNKYGLQMFQSLANIIQFTLVTTLPPIEKSLDYYCDQNDIPYVLVEIPGQNDILPRKYRVELTKYIVNYFETILG